MYNNKGFTLTESLIGMGLLGIVMVVGIQGFDYVKKSSDQVSTMNTTENRVNEIIQIIKSNVSQQIVSYPASTDGNQINSAMADSSPVNTFIEQKLNVDTLPMGWSINSDSPVATCTNCPGKYGYVITAIPEYAGLYLITVRFTHTEWGVIPKTFTFVVSK